MEQLFFKYCKIMPEAASCGAASGVSFDFILFKQRTEFR
jgi:hypothetical protein